MKNKTKERRKTISVPDFPADVWNSFAGRCKARGEKIKDGLERILRKHMKDEGRMNY